jgi:hypothetical protein
MLPLILGAISAASALAARNKSTAGSDAAENARAAINKVKVPSIEEMRAQLLQYVQQGIITPEQAQTIEQEQSAYRQIEEDPRLRGSQIQALSDLENQVAQGGLDARGRADLYQIGADQATQNRGEQQAVMADARARGTGGSDLEYVQRLLSQQGGAMRSAQQGVNTAAMAEQRRSDALKDQANLAGSLRSADYQKQADAAAAADAINRFNAANRQSQVNQNTNTANAAQAANLGMKQDVANMNVEQANRVPAQQLDAQFQKAGAKGNAEMMVGLTKELEAKRDAETRGNAISAFGQQVMKSDRRAKKDIKPFDASKLLDDISPYKFKYKPGEGPKGQMVGVMAQDIERHAPGAVHEGADGMKRVDTGQLGGILMAALAHVHKEVKELKRARS